MGHKPQTLVEMRELAATLRKWASELQLPGYAEKMEHLAKELEEEAGRRAHDPGPPERSRPSPKPGD